MTISYEFWIMPIKFNYADRKLNGVSKTSLKAMVRQVFETEKIEFDNIDYVFCSDEYLLKINQESLNHDYYTDIITFPLSEVGQPIIAEIYISVDRVKDNAKQLSQTFNAELARVVAHGALHLCGYKDKTKRDIAKMREKECFYLELALE